MKLGLILGVIDLGVYWGKFEINFGCVRFEGVLGGKCGVNFGCENFWGCFWKKN